MTGELLARLLIALGPEAIGLIRDLTKVWTRTLTVEEVLIYCNRAEKSYNDYRKSIVGSDLPPLHGPQ